eukprot:5957217-Prymnesium_polylepis.1
MAFAGAVQRVPAARLHSTSCSPFQIRRASSTGYGCNGDGGRMHLPRAGAATPRLGDWIRAPGRSTA